MQRKGDEFTFTAIEQECELSRRVSVLNIFTAFLFGFIICASIKAETLEGEVIGITDGDTLTLLIENEKGTPNTPEKTQIKIRLNAIDAPEKGQPFGKQSRLALGDICFRAKAIASVTATDRYNRIVADVTCNGKNANYEMVIRGMAWVFRKYAPESMYENLYAAEANARQSRLGLWSDPSPINPHDWRHRNDKQ